MTIQVELDPEVEARLMAESRAQGIPLEKVAEGLLHRAVSSPSFAAGNLSVEDFHAMLAALAEGSESLPDLPTDGFTRESFYEDRV